MSTFSGRVNGGRCSVFCSRTIATTANGTAMKKFARQLTASVRKPPRSGPPIVATAMMPPM